MNPSQTSPRQRLDITDGSRKRTPSPRSRTRVLEAETRSHLGRELLGVCAHALPQFGVKVSPALRKIPPVRAALYARRLLADADSATKLHTHWQSHADYLEDDGRPRVIPIQGPTPSFEALCKEYGLTQQSERLLALSCQFGLCTRSGANRLAYVSDVLLMTGHPTLMLARAAVTMERFLRTCVYNAKPGRALSESLGDRTAEVDLSEEEFGGLSRAARRYLSSFIESTDRLLLAGVARDRRRGRAAKPRRRCGVTAFVFHD